MDLSVIIINWNTRELLKQALRSVYNTVHGIFFEVLVVDNASSDGSAEMVQEEFPGVNLIRNQENIGFGQANNQAFRESNGEFILFLNSDACLVPGAVDGMLGALRKEPQVGISSVRIANFEGGLQFCYGDFPTLSWEFLSMLGLRPRVLLQELNVAREVDWVSGACLMIRRKAFDQIHGFDERFFMFGEEVDLCLRAKQAAWQIWLVPSQPVLHKEAGSSGKTPERILRLYQGKLNYFGKQRGKEEQAVLKWLMAATSYLKWVIYSILGRLSSRWQSKQQLWRGVCANLRTLSLDQISIKI